MPERDFDALYDAHAKTVYWAAYGVTRNAQSAEDVVQTVFLRAFLHLSSLGEMADEQVRAWLYRTAVNGAIDALRRGKRLVAVEDAGVSEPDLGPTPEQSAISKEERELVRATVDALPDKYREPILLYYFALLDYHSIADMLGLSEGTLKSRMARGREMMKKGLKKGGALRES